MMQTKLTNLLGLAFLFILLNGSPLLAQNSKTLEGAKALTEMLDTHMELSSDQGQEVAQAFEAYLNSIKVNKKAQTAETINHAKNKLRAALDGILTEQQWRAWEQAGSPGAMIFL